jgi:hypothetical protein
MAQVKPPSHRRLPLLAAAMLLALAAPATRAEPGDKADQAHALMGAGDAAGALRLMREHVAEHPDDRAARLDLARYYAWNGDAARAQQVLLADPEAAGSEEGRALHAYLLAGADRPRAARALDAPLLAADAAAFQANFNEALALMQTSRPMLAVPYVEAVERAHPGSKDSLDLARRAWVRRASFVSFGLGSTHSTDDISLLAPTLNGEYRVNDRLRLTGELGWWTHHADDGSFFDALGGDDLHQRRALVGLRYAPSEYGELQLAVGSSAIEGDSTGLWRARGEARFSDAFSASLLFERDRFAASPRALDLGLTRNTGELNLHFSPGLRWIGDAWLRSDRYSDDNTRRDLTLALRRSVLRKPRFSLDLGGVVERMHYDFATSNGYYAPDDYRRYGLTAHAWLGLGEESGIALHGVLGRQRDETFDSWKSANDFDATLIVGSLSKWEGRFTVAYSQRAQNTGAYEAFYAGAQVIRRFK